MKFLLGIAALFCSAVSFSQDYWQQRVDYTINVTLNDQNHTLKANLKLDYTNNSPQQLDYIWFHLWPNAYKNDQTAFAKSVFREQNGKKKWDELKDKGYIDSLDFYVNGKKAKLEYDSQNIDIAKLILPVPLEPGKKITITTPFFLKLPTYISRSGHIDQSYMICQWYPKPAVFDRKGWHAFPYLEMGEFYSEYGSFTVSITTPSDYVIAATGVMQNADELKYYKQLGSENLNNPNKKYTPQKKQPTKTITYHQDSIHDFAWFADKDFIIEYDTLQLNSGKVIDVFAYHPSYGNALWDKGTSYIKDAVRHYSNWIGEYAYPVVQAVEGPKNLSSGGMEYPTITLITSPDSKEEYLDPVIAHEVGHNWFYSILGSNEREHAWMDEGVNTFFEFKYEAEKYRSNSIFGPQLPADLKYKSLDDFESAIYSALARVPMDPAIDLPATSYKSDDEYGIVVYVKTALWLYLIELTEGQDKFSAAIKQYFNDWKFKHPYPEDFQSSFEKSMGKGLEQYFALLHRTGSLE